MTADRGRILVVEDKDNMRALLHDILAPRHDVALAADGTAAVASLESVSYEVVLTDVRMPSLDGFELVRLVKERWPLTEVVMMTAFASVPAAVEAIRRGAYDLHPEAFRSRRRRPGRDAGPRTPSRAGLRSQLAGSITAGVRARARRAVVPKGVGFRAGSWLSRLSERAPQGVRRQRLASIPRSWPEWRRLTEDHRRVPDRSQQRERGWPAPGHSPGLS